MQVPPIDELEAFWHFYHKRSIGRMRGYGNGNGYATLRTLLSAAKKFKGGFIRRTGTKISDDIATAINQVSALFFYYAAWGSSSN